MLQKNNYIKLVDFGLGKKLKDDRTFTLCGTPQYMAPEVIDSKGKGYGIAVDYWALGILIFEMIAGTTPFDDKDPYEIFKNIQKKEVKFPKWIKYSAKTIIKGLLKKDPDE